MKDTHEHIVPLIQAIRSRIQFGQARSQIFEELVDFGHSVEQIHLCYVAAQIMDKEPELTYEHKEVY